MILNDKSCYEHVLKINAILLGVIIDKNVTFKKHIVNLVRKAHHKLHVLRRNRKFLFFSCFI